MSTKRPKRPRDQNQLAKLIVDIATGELADPLEKPTVKRAQKAGKRGGAARADVLTPEERSKIARIAAEARWKKKP
ncbi:MAG: histone H1 [Alphaproteobacteria bacterium]|nr:histone H1 [Alphaproteobacteria bacterium]